MKRYSNEIYEFIRNNVKGVSTEYLATITNEKFGTEFTPQKMKSFKKNHGLKSGVKGSFFLKGKSKLFTPEIKEFIKNNALGLYNKDLTELVNKTFKTNYTVNQIDCYKANNKISSGLTGQFKKGSIPHNKGQKMSVEVYEKCSKTMFKKGHPPHNYRPVGSELITKDGYIVVKTKEPNIWQSKHVVLWEQHNGPLPENHKVIFLDGDRQNIKIENLKMVSADEWCEFTCRLKVSNQNPEITESGLALAKLKCTIRKTKKKYKEF